MISNREPAESRSERLDTIIKFRAPQSLLDRLKQIAVLRRRRKVSDLLRVVLEDYADAQAPAAHEPVKEEGHRHGEKVWNAKFREEDISRIFERVKAGETMASIARDYKVGRSAIWMVVHGHRWAHLGIEAIPPSERRRRMRNGCLQPEYMI